MCVRAQGGPQRGSSLRACSTAVASESGLARIIHDAIAVEGRDHSEKGARRTTGPRRTVCTPQVRGAPYALRSKWIGSSKRSRRELSGLGRSASTGRNRLKAFEHGAQRPTDESIRAAGCRTRSKDRNRAATGGRPYECVLLIVGAGPRACPTSRFPRGRIQKQASNGFEGGAVGEVQSLRRAAHEAAFLERRDGSADGFVAHGKERRKIALLD